MKLNKSKNKGKVHPSPSSSSSSSSNNYNKDPTSILNYLLPTAIFTLISVLSLQDQEALAYMITHSLHSSSPNHYPASFDPKKNPNKKLQPSSTTNKHISPCFDCFCFDCFSHFWNRWDSSPHSELINRAIEAFEEHLSSSETTTTTTSSKAKKNKDSKRRVKMAAVAAAVVEERGSSSAAAGGGSTPVEVVAVEEKEKEEVVSPEIVVVDDVEERENEEAPVTGDGEEGGAQMELEMQQQQHKGLARKVLPDVIGLFHSRFWKNLWGPNV